MSGGGGKCPAFGRHSIADRLTDRQRLYRQNVNAATVIPGEKLRALNQLVAKRPFHGSPLHQLVYRAIDRRACQLRRTPAFQPT